MELVLASKGNTVFFDTELSWDAFCASESDVSRDAGSDQWERFVL